MHTPWCLLLCAARRTSTAGSFPRRGSLPWSRCLRRCAGVRARRASAVACAAEGQRWPLPVFVPCGAAEQRRAMCGGGCRERLMSLGLRGGALGQDVAGEERERALRGGPVDVSDKVGPPGLRSEEGRRSLSRAAPHSSAHMRAATDTSSRTGIRAMGARRWTGCVVGPYILANATFRVGMGPVDVCARTRQHHTIRGLTGQRCCHRGRPGRMSRVANKHMVQTITSPTLVPRSGNAGVIGLTFSSEHVLSISDVPVQSGSGFQRCAGGESQRVLIGHWPNVPIVLHLL